MQKFINLTAGLCLTFLLPVVIHGQNISHILIDQFGYLPNSVKTAVIKNPKTGFDKDQHFIPSSRFQVVDVVNGQPVYEGSPQIFNSGMTDEDSGDQVWWFDFSAVQTPGRYYIYDAENKKKSYPFNIGENVYGEVLKHAVRMFYYQRAGFEKEARFAGEGWADRASHVGPLQDKNCRLYNKKDDASTERDLHGGWFDAGDYNKYTSWAARYVENMLLSYLENPSVWTDDYNLPDSGNGVPDLLDEAKWGMDWLLRMQETDGSVLCIVGLSEASPPSAATGQSLYGPATTMASFSAARAFALGYKVYGQLGMTDYAGQLREAAIKAWNWAEQHPNVIFHNNSASNGSAGVGAGDQEVEASYNREAIRISAALYLYEMTGDKKYLDVFDRNYTVMTLFAWNNDMQQYWSADHFLCFYYLALDGVTESVKANIRNTLKTAFVKPDNYAGKLGKAGYRSYIKDYKWGSNESVSDYGMTYYFFATHSLYPENNSIYAGVAEDYLHYLHGVNPLGLVYLTNMNACGASNSLTSIFHAWYCDKSPRWDAVGISAYGPPPGYLSGGANKGYKWDDCCPNGCGSTANNAACLAEEMPVNQPAAKMYKDFNNSWPLNSWEITEPSGGYQIAYIRLLSKFAKKGENVSIPPVGLSPENAPEVYPNPVTGIVNVRFADAPIKELEVFDAQMRLLKKKTVSGHNTGIDLSSFPPAVYFLKITTEHKTYMKQIILTK